MTAMHRAALIDGKAIAARKRAEIAQQAEALAVDLLEQVHAAREDDDADQ